MPRLEQLKNKIDELYQTKKEGRADWADWLYKNHIFMVAKQAEELADKFNANKELAVAASMLHDIADAKMSRFNPGHEEESERIAKSFLQSSNFSDSEISIIVDDAMRRHSCRDGNIPCSLEGKIMATADAVVHLTSNFYENRAKVIQKEQTTEDARKWALPKIERDFKEKILFEEIREKVMPDYERIRVLISGEF